MLATWVKTLYYKAAQEKRREEKTQDLLAHQHVRRFIILYTNMAGGGGLRGGRKGWGNFFQVETTASILYRPTLWWGYRPSSDSEVPHLPRLHSHSLCCHGTLLAIARGHKEQLTADSPNLSWERYLDNRLCRIGPGHLLEFILSTLGKMKVMQVGDVGKPEKRRKKLNVTTADNKNLNFDNFFHQNAGY